MSFLKNLFNKEQPQRKLTHVEQLDLKDVIQFTDSFALPQNLRKQQFVVTAVNTYEYEYEKQLEWVLQGGHNDEIYLSLDKDDQVYLKIALKIQHHDVETLFDLDAFGEIFEEEGNAFLEKQADSELSQGWTSDQYQQTQYSRAGYFHRKDHRTQKISKYEGKSAGEPFELYQLLDQDEARGVELEVWQDGDTDVFLTLYRPLSDIIDMYPGS